MSLAQMRAVLGKRIRPNAVAGINAQLPYLASLRAREDEAAYRDKMYGLERENLGLAKDRLGEYKQQGQTAKRLGYATLGTGAGLGLMNAMNQPEYDTLKEVTPTLSGVARDLPFDMTADFKGTAAPTESFMDTVSEYVPDFLKNIYTDVAEPFLDTLGDIFG